MKTLKELRNIAMMLSDDLVTVKCVFDVDPSSIGQTKYTYVCLRSLAVTLRKGMAVVVTCNKAKQPLQLVYVEDVETSCVLDDTGTVNYRWIVQKVDSMEADRLSDWSDEMGERLYAAQRAKAQAAMIAELGLDVALSSPALSYTSPPSDTPFADDAEIVFEQGSTDPSPE